MIRNRLVTVAALVCSVAGTCAAQDMGITRYGAQVEPLVESYLKDKDGTPLGGENAWPLLRETVEIGLAALSESDAPSAHSDSCFVDAAKTDRAMTPQVRARAELILEEMERRGVFQRLDSLAAAERFVRPVQEGALLDWLLPEIGGMRVLARASVIRMRFAFDRTDGAAAVRSFRHMLALGRAAAFQTTLIERLVGTAIVDLACNEMRYELAEHRWDEETLRGFAGALGSLALPPASLAFEGERLMGLDTVRQVYEDPSGDPFKPLDELAGGSEPGKAKRVLGLAGIVTQKEAEEYLERMYARLIAATKLPHREMVAEVRAVTAEIDEAPPQQAVAKVVMPALSKAALAMTQLDAMTAGTNCMLAIEQFNTHEGAFPERLEQLVPEFLATLPADPYSDAGFIYRRMEDDDPATPAYILYTAGWDNEDNGGVPHPRTPAAATNTSGLGYDFVFSTPRPSNAPTPPAPAP